MLFNRKQGPLWSSGGSDPSDPPQQAVQRLHVLRLLLQQLVSQAGDVLFDLFQLTWRETGKLVKEPSQ